MPLEEDLIRRVLSLLAVKEVIEGHFVQRSGGCERRNVPSDSVAPLVGANDHRQGVPADDALDLPFQHPIARVDRLLVGWDRVDVRRGCGGR